MLLGRQRHRDHRALPVSGTIAWLRSAASLAPSSSESAPATTAAAISPWEWPTTAPGLTPKEAQSSRQGDHHREEGGLDDLDLLQ